jgi:hypothetical protein
VNKNSGWDIWSVGCMLFILLVLLSPFLSEGAFFGSETFANKNLDFAVTLPSRFKTKEDIYSRFSFEVKVFTGSIFGQTYISFWPVGSYESLPDMVERKPADFKFFKETDDLQISKRVSGRSAEYLIFRKEFRQGWVATYEASSGSFDPGVLERAFPTMRFLKRPTPLGEVMAREVPGAMLRKGSLTMRATEGQLGENQATAYYNATFFGDPPATRFRVDVRYVDEPEIVVNVTRDDKRWGKPNIFAECFVPRKMLEHKWGTSIIVSRMFLLKAGFSEEEVSRWEETIRKYDDLAWKMRDSSPEYPEIFERSLWETSYSQFPIILSDHWFETLKYIR